MAALYGRDPGSLQTAAEVLVLRGVHRRVEAANSAIVEVLEQPLPPPVTMRRPLKSWYLAVRQVVVPGGFLGPPPEHSGELSHSRLRAIAG